MAAGDFEWWEETDPRGGRASMTSGRSLTRTIHLQWDAATDPPPSAPITAGALALPSPTGAGIYFGAAHPDFSACVCTDLDYEVHADDPFLWIATITYTEPRPVPGTAISPPPPPPPGSPPAPPPANPRPENRPALAKTSFRYKERYQTRDLDGLPIVNSAGSAFADAPPVPEPEAIITVTIWRTTWTTALGLSYVGKVNLAAWNGHPADSLLIAGVDANPKTQDGCTFVEVVFSLQFKAKNDAQPNTATGGWIPTPILNSGYEVRIPKPGAPGETTLVPATSIFGEKHTSPVLLDEAGGAIDPLLAGSVQTYKQYRFKDRISFAILS